MRVELSVHPDLLLDPVRLLDAAIAKARVKPRAIAGFEVVRRSIDGRKGKVRVTPDEAFATGDQLSYLLGQASACLQNPRDVDAKLHLDMLIEHIPALYDSTATHPFRGVAVKPNAVTPTLILPSTFTARAAHFDGTTNYSSSSINVPAGNQGMMSFWFRNRDTAWDAIPANRICQFRVGSSIEMEVRLASAGRITFTLKQNGSGPDVFTVPTDTFTNDVWHHVAWSWDQVADRFQLFVDGVALDTSAFFWGDGNIQMAGANLTRIGIGGNIGVGNQLIGDLGHLWLDFTQSLDLAAPGNLAKFLNGTDPADLGATGELPTGVAPQYYYDGDGAGWANLGTAGNVGLNGAITAADSTPSL